MQHFITSMKNLVFISTIVIVFSCSKGLKFDVGGNNKGGESANSDTPPASGSSESQGKKPSDGKNMNFYEHVAPIIAENCRACHTRADGIAPFPLETYEDVVKFAGQVKDSMKARRMPPPGPDNSGACESFTNARWVTDQQIEQVAQWVDGGMEKGDPRLAPPEPPPPPTLNNPDVIVQLPQEYTPNPEKGAIDDYRCFVVDPKLKAKKFITGYEMLPGEIREVHHIILFKIASDSEQKTLEAKKSADGFPGYECFGGPGGSGVPQPVAVWAPGVGASIFPDNTGIPLEAGRKLVMQVHYNTAKGKFPDKSGVALELADSAKPSKLAMLANFNLNLPGGKQDIVASANISRSTLALLSGGSSSSTMTVYAVGPHMHTAGTKVQVDKVSNGKTSCMMKMPKWDFNWQSAYEYKTPIKIGPSDSFKLTCNFNTVGRTATTKFGENTADEMCLAFIYVVEN